MNASETPALGVALVGHSFMGKAHSNAWRNVRAFYPDVPPVAQRVLVGRDGERAAAAARQYGWDEVVTDWRSVLERDDIHILDICTPGHLHAEMALAGLAAGKHVLVEKPLANSVAEAEAMASAAEAAAASGVFSTVGFNYRRVPALALAKRLIADGRIGVIRHVRIAYLQDWLADAEAPMTWRLRRETAGSGVIGDLASHAADQLGFLTGQQITGVSGHLTTFVEERPGESGLEPVTVDDTAWATLRTDGGVIASLEVTRMATGRKNSLQIELFGSQGSIAFDMQSLNELRVYDALDRAGTTLTVGGASVLVTEPEHPYLAAWWPTGHGLGWDHTFTNQAADFLTAIATGTPPTPSFADGLGVQRVLAAIEESAAQDGRTVPVSHSLATELP